jgi:hypothetical protein
MIIYILVTNQPKSKPALAGGIPCDQLEHTQTHYHAALQIMYQGALIHLPSNIGIVTDPQTGTVTCFYWLHVHAQNPDTIHIESPANQTFTLGQFFDVWNTWSVANGQPAQKLDATHVSTFTLTPEQKLVMYLDVQDGKGPQPYAGDPRAIVLKAHEVITLEVTPPDVTPPSFTFTSGL